MTIQSPVVAVPVHQVKTELFPSYQMYFRHIPDGILDESIIGNGLLFIVSDHRYRQMLYAVNKDILLENTELSSGKRKG